ncbi:SGNH/GDSL hydrolase family protein [Neobacillus sedimentimangrovi]|uniref:SGNH/GDSL hydrolase family protein n=1 Tax=Neobacillus sedimentimangrovi TaxID=2699460 RepID=A0ABS8QM15_9BACI|nr:SGNH/GDSL hydrolase family protein [Neobacillus sedimentimangrovi]MCD4840292.1 SGNH/GDSL hydrolase family protein [Neobacillus sedimentimangrovi]
MKKLLPLLIISAIFLSSCFKIEQKAIRQAKETTAKAFETIPANESPSTLTVLSAGDSLTLGVGDSTGQGGYLPYLESMLEEEEHIKEVDFYNYGVKGNRSDQLLKRLQSNEMKEVLRKADLVILTIGGNDIMKVVKDNFYHLQIDEFMKGKDVFENNLSEIMETILQENPDVSIVLVGLYNPFSKWFSDIKEFDEIVSEWNNTAQSVISRYPNAYYVGIKDLFTNSDENLLYSDNFHPNDKGYELIAHRLNETLESKVLPDMEKKSFMVTKEEN